MTDTNEENLLNTSASENTPEKSPEKFPEKFKDPKTGELQIDLLLKSYAELEKKQSASPQVPKMPEDYPIKCDHGMFEPDMDINRRLHEKGFNPDQAQAVYDLAAERMLPMLKEVVAEFRAEREIEKLVNHFGGAENWSELSRQLLSFGQKNLPADVLDNLSSSFEGVLALYRMMKSGAEPKLAGRKSTAVQGNPGEAELSSMMRNPKYWRERDPSFVAKVTQGFENLYGK